MPTTRSVLRRYTSEAEHASIISSSLRSLVTGGCFVSFRQTRNIQGGSPGFLIQREIRYSSLEERLDTFTLPLLFGLSVEKRSLKKTRSFTLTQRRWRNGLTKSYGKRERQRFPINTWNT